MSLNIDKILEKEEKMMWSRKPDVKSLLFFCFLCSIMVHIFTLIIFLNLNTSEAVINKSLIREISLNNVFYIVLAVHCFFIFVIPVLMYRFYKITNYIVTNKRLIIKTGFIDVKMRSVYFDQMRSTFVNTNLIGALFGTGTILIDANKTIKNRRENLKTSPNSFRFINFEDYLDFIQETQKMKLNI